MTDDAPAIWPASADLCAAVTQRVNAVLNEQGKRLAPMIRLILSREDRVLSPKPRPQSSVLVAFACVSAGAAWQRALWSAVAMECAMAAADVFDDVADLDPGSEATASSGVLLTAAAGLLAHGQLARVVNGVGAEVPVIDGAERRIGHPPQGRPSWLRPSELLAARPPGRGVGPVDHPREERRARYVVLGQAPMWVFRYEDYEMMTHWECRPTEPADGKTASETKK